FFDTEIELGKRNRRYAYLLGQAIKLLAQFGRTILDHVNANIRVEHVLQHQSGSRSSTAGCSRWLRKSFDAGGPFTKTSSQRRPAGVTILLWPSLMIST